MVKKYSLLGCLSLALSVFVCPLLHSEEKKPEKVSYVGKAAPDHVPDYVFAMRKWPGDGHWYANFAHYAASPDHKAYAAGGSALCRYHAKTGKISVLMEDKEGGFRDPVVHWDGKKILFSYRKGGTDNYNLYEIGVDGKNLKQITNDEYDDIEACYLPDDRIMFVSSRCKRWVNCWLTPVAIIYRCEADGSNIEQISANIEHDNTPVVLPNGQILYTRWEYIDRSQVDFHHLWMMNPDGTRQSVYMGNQTESVPGACLLIDARPIPETNEVLTVYSWGHGMTEHGGALTRINPSKGPDDRSQYKGFYGNEQGAFFDPYPYSATHFTVSNSAQVFLGTFKEDPYEILFELTEDQKKEGMKLFEPRPIQKIQRPPVIPDMVDNKKDFGEMILFDVYQGRNMEGVERGCVKYLLVLESLPKPINFTGGPEPTSFGGTFTLERVVGIVPVEEDGSAYMKLPKDRAFFFVALDKDMSAVQRMQSFTSVRGGEVISCIGCHETRQETPMADNNKHTPMALRKPVVEPISLPGIPEVFDFPRDIQPILDKHCIQCHNGDIRSGGKNLTSDDGPVYTYGYFTLMGGLQVADGHNSKVKKKGLRVIGDAKSPLIEKVMNKHHDVALSDEEVLKLRFWINAGASFPGTYAALGSGMIGRMYANGVDRTITNDERIKKAAQTINESCVSCHPHLPRTICDEGPMTMEWGRHELSQGSRKVEDFKRDIQFVRHALYNFTNPEQSALLKAPLAKEAGGYGMCKDAEGKPIFASKDDPRYQILLEAVKAGQEELNRLSRFTRPGFVPDPAYTREMKGYGVLSQDQSDKEPYNVYETDKRYWESLWKKDSSL